MSLDTFNKLQDIDTLRLISNFNELQPYTSPSTLKNLHSEAFLETLNVLINFINSSQLGNEQRLNDIQLPLTSKVCNSIMGAKTLLSDR